MYYDKRIRYLSYYESGIKLQNAGYVKFQVRDSLCQMVIFMKGPRLMGSGEARVYLLSEKPGRKEEEDFYPDSRKSNLQKHLLGNVNIRNGQGHCAVRMNAENMGDTGLRYDEVCGIKIELHEYQYLESRWVVTNYMPGKQGMWNNRDEMEKDEPTGVDLIVTPVSGNLRVEKLYEEETEETDAVERLAEEALENVMKSKNEEASKEEQLQDKEESMQEIMEKEIRKEESIQAKQPEDLQEAEALQEEEVLQEAEDEQETGEITVQKVTDEVELSEEELQPDKWEQLRNTYPIVHPIREEEEYLKIAPKDFVVFTEKYQELVHNSFLLHGYYNYKHLILGKKENEGKAIYYLGVPGTFHEREKTVAVMFGFEAFDGKKEPAENGDFGYYLRRVEI